MQIDFRKQSRSVVLIGAARSAIGSFMGGLSTLPAARIAADVCKQLLAQSLGDQKDAVDEVIVGNVLTAGQGQAPAKQVAVFSGLKTDTDCLTIGKVCGSGLKSISLAVDSILLGRAKCVLAGGMESMSNVPYYLPTARAGLRMGHAQVIDGMVHDGLWDCYNNFHMGNAGELCAKEMGFNRESQDAYAIESYKRAQTAQGDGDFKREILPVQIPQRRGDPVSFDVDEEPSKVKFDKIPTLKPVFQKDGTITAANASSINDGAAFVLVADEAWAKAEGFKPIARITAYSEAAQKPEWFTTTPVVAIERLAATLGKKPNGFGAYEINEAFAVVPMAAIKKLDLSPERVNLFGGAISLGHPIGCSGARVVVTLMNVLQSRSYSDGLATLCIGGGEAAAMGFERI